MQKVRVIYTGRVQGVGFRFTVSELAKQYAVVGSVCNVSNGTVELNAVGDAKSLMELLEAIDRRMSRYIDNCLIDWSDAQPDEFSDFSISPDKWGE